MLKKEEESFQMYGFAIDTRCKEEEKVGGKG